ncbi:MAG: GatB/YqeY domain-containing protein [Pseudomonadota bacterium]
MGQADTTVMNATRDRILHALRLAESEDSNGVTAQTLRLLKCAMNDRDVAARGRGDCGGCEETEIESLLGVMVNQRQVSARELDDAGRVLEAEREREEIEIISQFLPEALAGDALDEAVKEVVSDLNAAKLKDMGRCMSALRKRYPGRIECGSAGKAVRAALG